MNTYDFKAARDRRQQLVTMYRQSKRLDGDMAGWALVAMIEELDQEMAEAHTGQNGKMTTVGSSGHPVMKFGNIITPIVPQWSAVGNRGTLG